MTTLTSCISIDYDLGFLPHFIKHYSKFGIDRYKIILHSNQEFNILNHFHFFKPIEKQVELIKWVGVFNASDKVDKLNELQKEGIIITADVDEFQIWEQPIDQYSGVIWGKLRDREPVNGILPEITSEDIELQFPLITKKSNWGRSLFKPCLYPHNLKLLSPHHLQDNEPKDDDFIDIDHYRWVEGRLEKSIERLKNYKELNNQGRRMYKYFHRFPTRDLQNVVDEYGNVKKPKI